MKYCGSCSSPIGRTKALYCEGCSGAAPRRRLCAGGCGLELPGGRTPHRCVDCAAKQKAYSAKRQYLKRHENPERVAEQARQHRLRHPDRCKQRVQAWVQANREHVRADARARYLAEREQRRVATALYYTSKRDEILARNRAYRRANPEKKKALESRRRARLTAVADLGDFTSEEWSQRMSLFGGLCAYCPEKADCVDHVIPLSKGGDNTIFNVVPACRSRNSSKKDMLPLEWVAREDAVRRACG